MHGTAPPELPDGAPLALLETILDAIPAPIFFKDAEGVYRGCNRAFEAYLGLPRERIVGRTVEDVAPPELARVYREADDALFRSPGVQTYEARVRGAGGRLMDVVFHKATFTDAGGRVAGLVGTYLDITEQKRAERALRESEQRLQLALDATDQVSWDWDVRAGSVVVGPQVARLLGREPASLATQEDLAASVHPDDDRRVLRAFRAHLAGATPGVEAECRLRHADGEWRWFLVSARCVERDEGGPRRVVGTAVEITRMKQLHERLVLSDKLSALGTLAAGVAHEINNPLAVVAANVEFAAATVRELASGDPRVAEAERALADARAGAERVARIVGDLKAYSRPGELRERLDLREVARSALNLAKGELKGRCALALELGPVPSVVGDASQLAQVVVNLLVNAAQSLAAQGGAVRVATGTTGDGRAFLEVTDDGCGIGAEALPRIFDPFFTTKAPGVGTGLGLFLCHRTVTALGGEIRVESAPGRGSSFRVLLPSAPAQAVEPGAPVPSLPEHAEPPPPPAPAPEPAPPAGRAEPGPPPAAAAPAPARRARVLVVDDEPVVARAMERALSRRHDVTTAAGGRAAVERLLAGERFDAVVCDLVMPDVGGEAVWERVREISPDLAARVVFVTGAASVAVQAFLDRAGARVLPKPFTAAELGRAIDEALAAG